jgi:hypothetical protein
MTRDTMHSPTVCTGWNLDQKRCRYWVNRSRIKKESKSAPAPAGRFLFAETSLPTVLLGSQVSG